MVCYHPNLAYQHKFKVNPNTGRPLIVVVGKSGTPPFSTANPSSDWIEKYVRCGQCIGCRLDNARSWGVRGVHEAKMHDKASFLTLTVDDEHMYWSTQSGEQTLNYDVVQKFFKRLRKNTGQSFRYICCGEYGSNTHRPHYHVLLYGLDFKEDRYFYKLNKYGDPYFISPFLDDTWQQGNCCIGQVNFQTCAYVGRYVTKKLNGEQGKKEYEHIDEPFIHASNRPGIGAIWFEQFHKDVYPYDRCVINYNGNMRLVRPPRYYDKLLEKMDPEMYDYVKSKREEKAEKFTEDIYNDRLFYKELYKIKVTDESLRRDLE